MEQVIKATQGDWVEIKPQDVTDTESARALGELSRTAIGFQAHLEFAASRPVRFFALVGSTPPSFFYLSHEEASDGRYPLLESEHRVVVRIEYEGPAPGAAAAEVVIVGTSNIDPFVRYQDDIETLAAHLGVAIRRLHYPHRRDASRVIVFEDDVVRVIES